MQMKSVKTYNKRGQAILYRHMTFIISMLICFNLFPDFSFASNLITLSYHELKQFGVENISEIDEEKILNIRQVSLNIPEYEAKKTSIATMKLIDLNRDGKQDIVTLLNFGGTIANPLEIFLLYTEGEQFIVQRFFTERAILEETILDLNNDGVYEICANVTIVGKTPHVLTLYWVDVYSWDGYSYLQNNEQFFESFYLRHYLPQMSKRLNDASMRLELNEKRSTLSSVLEDCRTALGKISSMSNTETFQKHSRTLRDPIDPASVRNTLSTISMQLVRTQELLRQNAQNEEVRSALQASQELLQQMSRTPNLKK